MGLSYSPQLRHTVTKHGPPDSPSVHCCKSDMRVHSFVREMKGLQAASSAARGSRGHTYVKILKFIKKLILLMRDRP